jgi:membrane protease YdiL (CAAX protease family)
VRYCIPVFLLAVPSLIQGRINLRFSAKDILAGIIASVIILVPFAYFAAASGKVFTALPAGAALYQLAGVAFPEEVYFRGFLQEKLGNTIRGLFLVSFLFSLMHLPQFIFYRDPYALLTFFPSLVMGFLYLRTSNILAPMIFHFLSNSVFLSFYAILKN